MECHRLPKRILLWDYKCGAKGWLSDIKEICEQGNILSPDNTMWIYDIEPIQRKFLLKERDEWKDAAEEMSKLCTYITVKDFTEIGSLVRANLPRNQRSLVARFLCGILPLEVETGRFADVDKHLRKCKVCEGTAVEDETHFLLKCPALKATRKRLVKPVLKTNPNYKNMTETEKISWLLDHTRMKEFGQIMCGMFDARQEIMYKKKKSVNKK